MDERHRLSVVHDGAPELPSEEDLLFDQGALTVRQAAELAQLSSSKVHELISRDVFPSRRICGRRRIARRAFLLWMQNGDNEGVTR